MTPDEQVRLADRARQPLPDDRDADAVLQARRDLLSHRDHVIGLEAEAAALQQLLDKTQQRQQQQKNRIAEVRAKLDAQRRRADRLQRELDELRAAGEDKSGRRLLLRRGPGQ